MLVEVGLHWQFPNRAFIVGLDPGVTKRERLPTAEEVAGYNLIRRFAAQEGAAWEMDFLGKLHYKLARAIDDLICWTANDLINQCERQIPELLSQVNSAEALGDARATIFVGPTNGASILMALLGQIIEAVTTDERDPFDEIDLQPESRIQLTRAAMQLLTPSIDLFDWFLVAFDPDNGHRRHAEERQLAAPEPSDYFAELNRLLGLQENVRFEDLEFALPEYW